MLLFAPCGSQSTPTEPDSPQLDDKLPRSGWSGKVERCAAHERLQPGLSGWSCSKALRAEQRPWGLACGSHALFVRRAVVYGVSSRGLGRHWSPLTRVSRLCRFGSNPSPKPLNHALKPWPQQARYPARRGPGSVRSVRNGPESGMCAVEIQC